MAQQLGQFLLSHTHTDAVRAVDDKYNCLHTLLALETNSDTRAVYLGVPVVVLPQRSVPSLSAHIEHRH